MGFDLAPRKWHRFHARSLLRAIKAIRLEPEFPECEKSYIVLLRPTKRLIKKRTMKIMKQILAIPAEAAAIPPKPRIAAMIAITRNTQAYQSMQLIPSLVGISKSGAKLPEFTTQPRL